MSLTYVDFIVRLRDWRGGQFKVEVIDAPVGRMRYPETVHFNRGILHLLDTLENPQGEDRLSKEDLIELGEALGDMLFPIEVRGMLQKSLAHVFDADGKGQGFRLVLEVDDPHLSIVPWEFVYLWEYTYIRGLDNDPMDGFLARDPRVSIVRHESFVALPEKKLKPVRKLQVFVGMAEPDDLGEDLDLETEFKEITDELKRSKIDFIQLKDAKLHLNPEVLEQTCKDGAHIFHFSGHGGFFPEAAVDEDHRLMGAAKKKPTGNGEAVSNHDNETSLQSTAASQSGTRKKKSNRRVSFGRNGAGLRGAHRGAIVLEKGENDKRHHILWSDELAKVLRNGSVRVVLLSSCQSATRDPISFVWTGVAPALMKANLPAVVAMQYVISDHTAILFSKHFYRALAAGLSLDEAVANGRREIMALPGDERDQDWGVPVLYLRYHDGEIFPELSNNRLLRRQRRKIYKEMYKEDYPEMYNDLREWILSPILLILLLIVLIVVLLL